MKTLFARSFTAFFVSLVLLVFVILAVFLFGIRRSIGDWNMYRRQSLQNLIVPSLNEIVRREGSLSPESVERELSQFLNPNQYVYVFDAQRRPVFLYHGGERRAIEDPEVVAELIAPLEQHDAMPAALFDEDVVIGFLAADTLGFMSDIANIRFLRSVTLTLLVAVVLAGVLAFVPAYSISRGISNSVKKLAAGLAAIGEGKRDIRFQGASTALELKRVADSAEALQAQLLAEEQLRRQWAEDISHDLRTPLTAFRTQLEGMLEGVFDAGPERLHALFGELLQIEHLVQDLRELSRIESPELNLEYTEIDSTSFLEMLIRRGQAAHPRTDISYRTQVERKFFLGDEQLLIRAVDNIIQNAALHCDADGVITASVSTESSDNSTQIEISNTGYIDPSDLLHVFERLYRGTARSKETNSSGSGLGLAIAKAIVDAHNGKIRMHQNADTTQVTITLPNAASQ